MRVNSPSKTKVQQTIVSLPIAVRNKISDVKVKQNAVVRDYFFKGQEYTKAP